ncbi:LysE family translocator [Roseospira marina]|uniref:LysE family translocator n=1 Tax=Roseospira marina TaxID=140057 RepID=A0A5M6IE42_9PROT|nr:LysE family translocator [Roseospira marina]KAA5606550.1 LysE family translocator [Roseospira marina]MBB4314020.1 threonine/homoserine/homoserine lactone efflux protein [Roseospira marina]MBB5087181.1 threonine/homoserine/homoserine lactone efflux protein [Roseospira marina]
MALDTWIAFTIACVVLTVIPGPSVMLVIAQALTRGRTAAVMCILGDVVGSIVLMGLSFAGVGAILAASALLFQVVKWAGVLYLAWLGIRQIRAARHDAPDMARHAGHASSWGSFWAGTVTAVLNPKAIVFYMAFLAQFIEPHGDLAFQLAVLTVTSSLVVVVLLAGYAVIAERAGRLFDSRRARRRMGYAGGGFMIGGSAVMAVTR